MRTFDPALHNRLANMPEVARDLCDGGSEMVFDFSEAIANPQNIFLTDGGAAAMFIWSAPRVFEGHMMVAPDFRGRCGLDALGRMRDAIMGDHADIIWCQPPLANRAARWVVRQLGFVGAGFGNHSFLGPVEYLTCRQS